MYITKCQICGSAELIKFLDLNRSPWCNNFLTIDQVGKEEYYPLELQFCKNCTLVQLTYQVEKSKMFSNHTYVSGTTETLKNHFLEIATDVVNRFEVKENDLIVDIGGNDGTNLLQYRSLGNFKLMNIESASNISLISNKNEVPTLCEFFNEETANRFTEKAKVINASGVFFHLEDLHSVCRGIEKLLSHEGVFVVQFMYLADTIENVAFDSIYHEHLLYYTKKSLCHLLEQYGLFPYGFYHSQIHGGSVIGYFTKKPQETIWIDGINLDEKETKMGLSDIKTYRGFERVVVIYRDILESFMETFTAYGRKPIIYGYGAPAKSTTLLNFCELDSYITFIEEKNELKCGLYTPGSHIPIVAVDKTQRPDYYFIFSWNFLKEFVKNEIDYFETGGKFIVPFPKRPFLVGKNNYKNYL